MHEKKQPYAVFHSCLFLTISLLLMSFQGSRAPLTEVFSREAYVFEPSWIHAEAGHRLWISDAVHERFALYRYDLEADQVELSLPVGRGPGELARTGMKWMSLLPDGDRMIYDTGAFRATRYNAELKNPKIMPMPRMNTQAMSAHVLQDGTLLMNPMSTSVLLSAYHYDLKTLQPGTQRYQLPITTHPSFLPLSNFLLKNGHAIQHGNAVYLSFLFAPYILKMSSQGLVWLTGTELGVGFPVDKKNPNGMRMPDAGTHPQQTLSIAADSRRVYVLHNGTSLSLWKSLWASVSNDYSEVDELVNASDRLRVYDARTGAFQMEWKLPVRARLVSVHSGFLYLHTTDGGQSRIIAYRMNR
jgi:hypothetical protein